MEIYMFLLQEPMTVLTVAMPNLKNNRATLYLGVNNFL